MSEDDESCIPCQVKAEDCSLTSSPQPRKRKLNGESAEEGNGKRRLVKFSHVFSFFQHLHR
jgi:hypothetical protein